LSENERECEDCKGRVAEKEGGGARGWWLRAEVAGGRSRTIFQPVPENGPFYSLSRLLLHINSSFLL